MTIKYHQITIVTSHGISHPLMGFPYVQWEFQDPIYWRCLPYIRPIIYQVLMFLLSKNPYIMIIDDLKQSKLPKTSLICWSFRWVLQPRWRQRRSCRFSASTSGGCSFQRMVLSIWSFYMMLYSFLQFLLPSGNLMENHWKTIGKWWFNGI